MDPEERRKALEEVAAEFDRRLASLQDPNAHARLAAVMAAKGRAKTRSKAGESV